MLRSLKSPEPAPIRCLAFAMLVAIALVLLPRVSLAAEPTVTDCLAASEAAVAERTNQRLRAARSQLLICSAASCPVDIREECAHGVIEMNRAIPTVVFTVKDASGEELTTVKVSADGNVVANQLDGRAISLDPGIHDLVFESAGNARKTVRLVLHEGEKSRSETVVLTPTVIQRGVAPLASPPPQADSIRITSYVLGGAGIVGLGLGAGFGVATIGAWHSANQGCPTHAGCSAQATASRGDAVTYATTSTVAFVAGAALLAGGVTLYFAFPTQPSVQVGAGWATLGWQL